MINYTTQNIPENPSKKDGILLDDMYKKCEDFFTEQKYLVPTKTMLGKLVSSVLKTQSSIKYIESKKYVFFQTLVERENSKFTTELTFPPHCQVKTVDSCLHITCAREYILNGERLSCAATLAPNRASIEVMGHTIDLNISIEPNQKNINGIVFLLENIKFCKGMQKENVKIQSAISYNWSLLYDEDHCDQRICSKACDKIISWNSKFDFCANCSQLVRKAVKRVQKQLDDSQTKASKLKCVDSELNVKNNNEESIKDDNEGEKTLDDFNKDEMIDKLLSKGAPANFKLLLHSQIQNCNSDLDIRQRRWDPQIISLCLSLYCKSPNAYENLRESEMLCLPAKSTLIYYKNCVKQTPGINHDNLTWMKKEAERQGVSSFGHRGGLLLDEMSIQDDLEILRKGDAWDLVGAVDMGHTNNIINVVTNNKKEVKLATHCLQFSFHGYQGFRWPVSYYASNPATTHQLYVTIWEIIDALNEYGFEIDYIMFDGATTNRSLTKLLIGTELRDSSFLATDIYNNDHKLAIIQDIKHVIKKIRNSILSSKSEHKSAAGRYLLLNNQPILWDHFEQAFKFNAVGGFRIHRKLTKDHIAITGASKMRNHYAEEVLNKDMLFLMKNYQSTMEDPSTLSSTVELLENTSILIEIFSDTRPVFDTNNQIFQKLLSVLKFFNDWEKSVSESKLHTTVKHLITQETRDDINSAITGFISLCELSLKDGNSLTPAYINSDLIENHFCQQRGICNGQNTNPTIKQYGPSNNAIILGQCTISSKRNSSTKASYFKATTPCPLNKQQTKRAKQECFRI